MRKVRLWSLEVGMVLCGLFFVLPLLVMINIALKDPKQKMDALLPAWPPTGMNIAEAWTSSPLAASMANSAIVTVSTVLLVNALGILAAYPLARGTRRWSTPVYYLFLAGLLIPGQLSLLPLYQTMRDLGLLGSLLGVILVHVGGQLPFAVFLFVTFLRDLPPDYEEASTIDGCTSWGTLTRIVAPLMRAVIGTVSILTAVSTWNSFLMPLLYLAGSGNETTPVALSTFVGRESTNYPAIFGGILITIIPLLVAYFAMQKSVIQGFASGVKG